MPNSPTAINRTLIVGLGKQGLAVLQALHGRMAERYAGATVDQGRYPSPSLPIASLALTSASGDTGIIPALYLSAPKSGTYGVWDTLDDHIDALTTGIIQALASVSKVSQGLDGNQKLRSAAVDVYLIAGLDDPLAGGLIDLAYLVRQLIGRRLNTHAYISGMLLLPDPLTSEEPEPALARTYAILKTLNSYMDPSTCAKPCPEPSRRACRCDGYRRAYPDGPVVEGRGSPFDRHCFLVGALNRKGLRLERPQAREHLVAEALLQFVAGALGPRRLAAEPTLRTPGIRPGYAGLGLASLVYPAQAIHEHLGRRLAHQILTTWVAPSESANLGGTEATAFLTNHGFSPTSVRHRLLPPELLAEAGMELPIYAERPWGQLDTLREALDEVVAHRLATLTDQRPLLDQAAETLARDLSDALDKRLTEKLDHPQPADLPRNLVFVRTLKRELLALARRHTERAETRRTNLQTLHAEADGVGEELATLGRQIAAWRPTTLRGAVALLLRPDRWLHLWRLWQALQQTQMAYIAHLQHQMEWTVEILETELLIHSLEHATSQVESRESSLTNLLQAVQTAMAELTAHQGATDDAETGFDLEWSVLTSRQMEALYKEIRANPAEELHALASAQGRLSAWVERPTDASAICTAVLAFARHRLRSVVELTVGQMLARRYPEAGQQREAIEALLEAAVPFIAWDETALHADEGEGVHETTVLGVPAPDFEHVAEVLESCHRTVSIVPMSDPHRIVVLHLVRGIPLAAIPIVHEAATCYARASDRAQLHGDPSHVRLPDPCHISAFETTNEPEETER